MSSDQHKYMSNVFMTITTVIFAISSLITVFISLSAWKEDREAERPYLTFQASPKVGFNDDGKLLFSFTFTNVGHHPAASLNGQTMILDDGLTAGPLHTDQNSLNPYLSQNSNTDLIITLSNPYFDVDKQNLNQQLIIINLKYADPILEKNHEQIIYLRWLGITDGQVHPILHASKQDKERIINYLKKI